MHQRAFLLWGVALAVAVLALPVFAAERELDQGPPPSSASEIATAFQRVFPSIVKRLPIFSWIRERLDELPPFFADTELEVRTRTYYLRKERTNDDISEAWAIGGSVYYRSGWLADLFAVEAEGFTSQPLYAPNDRDGTQLLEPVQDGYTVLGIANAKLRYKGLVLTGFRQYLDLPYINRQDNRMTPNTFESITLTKSEGEIRFSTGYTWRAKLRNSDEFASMTEVIGIDKDRGFVHAGALWDPNENFRVGAIIGAIPDLYAGIYSELSIGHDFTEEFEIRLDGQFSYQRDVGKDFLGEILDENWNVGIRTVASYAGAVFRLGFSITGSNGTIFNAFGSGPSYVDLMQRSFNRAEEKALLASASYDFSRIGVDGLSVIVNFVAGFDGKFLGERRRGQEIDATIDYRVQKGLLKNFWLRIRGSWLSEQGVEQDGTDVRVILRYDIPVI
ncbi:MAG: OprD family outer membrane porin [Deltaproteobacteria bacterium]|nr:OprD family outer membrane porin [Deltaproteobacteria bacterium]